jgi:hypothetical protein
MEPLTEQKKIECFRTTYRALHVLGETQPAASTPAVASLRLLLIDALGEERQKELVGAWNDDLRGA